jgi:pyridoxal phosphate enzyme (YggS family)
MGKVLSELRARIVAACEKVGRDPASVTLIGASKTVPAERLKPFIEAGLADLGENYVQEGLGKIAALPNFPGRWHFIGALQSNKARDVVRGFDVVHSVDRVSLANGLDKAAREHGKVQDILLQVNIGDEATKAGCSLNELSSLARHCAGLPNLAVRGLMCLPPYSEDAERARPYFRRMAQARADLVSELGRAGGAPDQPGAWHLSMGMSNDFEVAIEEGATMVRIGTQLFGARS